VTAVLELTDVSKNYQGLRPLRIADLAVAAGEQVSILGIDGPAAEVFVNLATGATLPDHGRVRLFGRPTEAIADSTEWLAVLDRLGIVSDRAVLLEPLSVIQNIAVPFTLEIEPPPDDVRRRAEALAEEVGLPSGTWPKPIHELAGAARARVRLARALALNPDVLLAEHATASVARQDVEAFAAAIRRIATQRAIAVVAATADPEFARALGGRSLTLDPSSGRLRERRGGGWLDSLRGRLG
jgi:ABC-type lipoprotein export system ATPase subunit